MNEEGGWKYRETESKKRSDWDTFKAPPFLSTSLNVRTRPIGGCARVGDRDERVRDVGEERMIASVSGGQCYPLSGVRERLIGAESTGGRDWRGRLGRGGLCFEQGVYRGRVDGILGGRGPDRGGGLELTFSC